ncbi:MAG: LLM class flavin-dependent oxidoreductase, partial [Candidatus Rokuibacteriota bacterium]
MRIKYRIGVMPGPWPAEPAGADHFWRFVDLCERADVDSLWFNERLSSPTPVLEPVAAMAAVAARTRRLKFGPSVLITPFRSPVLLARELATIDFLSGGRMLPALGVG